MVRVRPLESNDLEHLSALLSNAAERAGEESLLTRGAVSFYSRSGHAFVVEDDAGVRGFALAQAVWNGVRPTVRLQTVRVADEGDDTARAALLEAVTKSAYDAAVYDLVATVPEQDDRLNALLEVHGWSSEPVRAWRRTLGSRGRS